VERVWSGEPLSFFFSPFLRTAPLQSPPLFLFFARVRRQEKRPSFCSTTGSLRGFFFPFSFLQQHWEKRSGRSGRYFPFSPTPLSRRPLVFFFFFSRPLRWSKKNRGLAGPPAFRVFFFFFFFFFFSLQVLPSPFMSLFLFLFPRPLRAGRGEKEKRYPSPLFSLVEEVRGEMQKKQEVAPFPPSFSHPFGAIPFFFFFFDRGGGQRGCRRAFLFLFSPRRS